MDTTITIICILRPQCVLKIRTWARTPHCMACYSTTSTLNRTLLHTLGRHQALAMADSQAKNIMKSRPYLHILQLNIRKAAKYPPHPHESDRDFRTHICCGIAHTSLTLPVPNSMNAERRPAQYLGLCCQLLYNPDLSSRLRHSSTYTAWKRTPRSAAKRASFNSRQYHGRSTRTSLKTPWLTAVCLSVEPSHDTGAHPSFFATSPLLLWQRLHERL